VIKAATEYHEESYGDIESEEPNENARPESYFREKYDIPEGVFLFDPCEEGWSESDVALFKPFIKHWVSGRLRSSEANSMHFWFMEFREIDYGWVFMERPCFFYSSPTPPELESDEAYAEYLAKLDADFIEIGSRSRSKHPGKTFSESFYFGKPSRDE
jgi:hypothetical protein